MGRNTSEVEIEVKWGEGKKKKAHAKKDEEENCSGPRRKNIQQGGDPTQEWRWGTEPLIQRRKGR